MKKRGLILKFKLKIVSFLILFLNMILIFLERVVFPFNKIKNPKNILVFKVGNIGDTVCAMPSLLAIRKHFSNTHITFLSSPGGRDAPGAKELLDGSNLFDEMQIYYSEDISTKDRKRAFIKKLKEKKYDLFIQLPEDLAGFRTILRNIIFAKLIDAKRAVGFRINTTEIFKKEQVDNLTAPQETDRLLSLLKKYGISLDNVEFRFSISEESKKKVQHFLNSKFQIPNSKFLIALNPGGKRTANCWPVERYRELAEYLSKNYYANIVVLGGPHEKALGDEVISGVLPGHAVNACGVLSLLETAELLRHTSLLVANSTGTIHLGAAVGTPCVGIYTIRDIPGKWSPYGNMHRLLYNINFVCDYHREICISESINSVTIKEVKEVCDDLLRQFSNI